MYDKIIIVAYKKKLKSFQTFWEKPNILQQTSLGEKTVDILDMDH